MPSMPKCCQRNVPVLFIGGPKDGHLEVFPSIPYRLDVAINLGDILSSRVEIKEYNLRHLLGQDDVFHVFLFEDKSPDDAMKTLIETYADAKKLNP